MATVTVVQSATASSASASFITATLGSAPSTSDLVVAVIASSSPVVGLSDAGYALLGSNSANPYLYAYKWTGGGSALTALTVTQQTAGPLALFYFELSSAAKSLIVSTASVATTVASLTATAPLLGSVSVGDLPLAFFSSLPASTATAQSGWTNLATLNAANGNVLNAQSGPNATSAFQAYTGQVTWGTANPTSEILLLSANQSDVGLSSQEFMEVLGSDTALARSSQEFAEAIGQDTANARSSQVVLEVVGQDTALARSSQIFMELIVPLYERTSQEFMEVIGSDTAHVRTSQMFMEVLFSSQGQRRRVVEDELFTY